MEIKSLSGDLAEQPADTLVISLFEGVAEPGGATAAVDRALGGQIRELIGAGDFTGKLGAIAVLYPRGALPAARVLLVGLGRAADFSAGRARQALAAAAQRARDVGTRHAATIAHGAGQGGLDPARAAQATVEGVLLGLYEFRDLKSNVTGSSLESLTLVEADAAKAAAVAEGARAGQVIAESANLARDLVNQPPNVCTPQYLADRARAIAQEFGLSCKVLGVEEMRTLNMGALLAVAAASKEVIPPRFIILEYRPEGAHDQRPVVLVGKGITFDSGGLSIKTADGMLTMKSDMGGGAAVLGAMRAVAALKLPRPVIGLVPATENLVDGAGYRPSDVLRASNGKTIEIISTDAEGRLILADALVYAGRYAPAAVVDLATLTGACSIALGRGIAAGLFGTDESLVAGLKAAGERSGERAWPLPLYPEYSEGLKTDVADMRNSSGDRYAGVGWSAAFLKEFAEGYPWAHLDIAPVAYNERPQGPWPKGGTGFGVRLLLEWLRG